MISPAPIAIAIISGRTVQRRRRITSRQKSPPKNIAKHEMRWCFLRYAGIRVALHKTIDVSRNNGSIFSERPISEASPPKDSSNGPATQWIRQAAATRMALRSLFHTPEVYGALIRFA